MESQKQKFNAYIRAQAVNENMMLRVFMPQNLVKQILTNCYLKSCDVKLVAFLNEIYHYVSS